MDTELHQGFSHHKREKKKMCLADFEEELKKEEEAESEAAAAAAASVRIRPASSVAFNPKYFGGTPTPPEEKQPPKASPARTARLQREQLQPLVDLAYSESKSVQRSAIGLLATLAINPDNKDMLIESGSLKPLISSCSEETDLAVRRHALSGLANMTSREDIRARLCVVPGGLKACVDGILAKDVPLRLSAAECVANLASSTKLRGHLVSSGVLPAVRLMLGSRTAELKRWGMTILQRLAESNHGTAVTKEDPEGDGYADEIMREGTLQPLLVPTSRSNAEPA